MQNAGQGSERKGIRDDQIRGRGGARTERLLEVAFSRLVFPATLRSPALSMVVPPVLPKYAVPVFEKLVVEEFVAVMTP